MVNDTVKVLALPYFSKNNFAGTMLINPLTGKIEKRGTGNSVALGGVIVDKIQPTKRQLIKIRDDINRYLAHCENVEGV